MIKGKTVIALGLNVIPQYGRLELENNRNKLFGIGLNITVRT